MKRILGTIREPELGGSLPPRYVGRLVGAFFMGMGMLGLAALLLPVIEPMQRGAVALLAVVAMALGGTFLLIPWDRWPTGITILVASSGLGLAAAGTWLTADGPIPVSGLLFVVATLTLIGLVHRPGTTLLFAPLAMGAFVVPAIVRTGDVVLASAAAIAVPVGILLGEILARVVQRWRRSERAVREANRRLGEAYRRQRADLTRMQEIDEMKNAFLTAVSHELRTPLTAILGISTTLERSGDFLAEEEKRYLIGRITSNGKRLQHLLSDLLDLNRLTYGVLDPVLAPADLGALLRRTAGETDLPNHRIEVLAPSVWLSVDAPKVERIVENLLRNAGKYTPRGTTVWVRLEIQRNGIMLLVEDEGPGVPHELKREIFEPFRQGVSLPDKPGTGIGLSLVQRFAAMHGGSAEVWDRPGGGASFRVFLPGTPVADAARTEARTLEIPRAEPPRRETARPPAASSA